MQILLFVVPKIKSLLAAQPNLVNFIQLFHIVVEENGYNKIALGHHRDDLIRTLLMSIFYNGEIRQSVDGSSVLGL